MAVTKSTLLARHQAVRAEFNRLRDSKKYRYEYMLELVAKKCFYSIHRVEKIIALTDDDALYKPKGYNPDQTNLF